jgi:CheY-like chemotaxis protein
MDLNRAIVESERVFERIMGEDVELRTSLAPDLCAIEADRGEILQVLMNLMANAREAMPHGGTVRIETRNVWLAPDFQEQPVGAPFALLAVHDTGSGMDERTKRHLFEPFFTTKNDQRNTGLGLATVFGIVTHSGGHIGVSSEPGEGSTFKIYLPVVQASITVDVPEPSPAAGFRGSGTVLLVEDRADVRGVARSMLESVGYQVLEASGGEQAIHIAGLQAAPIDLLLTDIVMPGIDGTEVVERLMPSRPQMKIIFMSGYPGRLPLSPASAAYLQKPFTRAKLIEVLRQVME